MRSVGPKSHHQSPLLLVGAVAALVAGCALAPAPPTGVARAEEAVKWQPPPTQSSVVAAEAVPPLPDVTETAGLMGTCYAFYPINGHDPATLPSLMQAAGSRWDRFDFRWNAIEDSQGSFDFSGHEAIVQLDIDNGLDVIGILGSTAKWAAPGCHVMAQSLAAQEALDDAPSGAPLFPMAVDDDYWWRPCPPDGLDLAWNDPGNVWGNYVYTTVDYFKDDVHVWEIWNEPDLGQTFWSGTPAQYAQLLKVGYQAAKAADPNATVLFAGLAYWSNPSYYLSVLDALQALPDAAANNHFFDAMSLHLYSNVYTIRPVATEIYANMGSRVGAHPIWLTETGVPLWDEWPPGTPESLRTNRATGEEAAAYAIQAFAEARAIGIERFLWFRSNDDYMSIPGTGLHEYFGLVRNDVSLRPSYVAFQVAAKYLYAENQVTGPISRSGVRRITLWGTPRGRVDVLWNETGTAITYNHTAILPSATVVDVHGVTQTVSAVDGVLPLTLDAATANTAEGGSFLIGGAPLLVINEDTVAPQSTLLPLPTKTYSDVVSLSWDVLDDGAGLWYTEIEQARTLTGPWSAVAGWPGTQYTTTTGIEMDEAGTWFFRARARDRAGNWEDWPATAEVSTTVFLTRTVGLAVSAYIDANGNGSWDGGEPPAAQAALTWRDEDGSVIGSAVGATLEVTETLESGVTSLTGFLLPDYVAAPHSIVVVPGETPVRHEIELGFREVVAVVHLPIVTRGE